MVTSTKLNQGYPAPHGFLKSHTNSRLLQTTYFLRWETVKIIVEIQVGLNPVPGVTQPMCPYDGSIAIFQNVVSIHTHQDYWCFPIPFKRCIPFYWNVCINYIIENLTEHVNYAVEVEVFGGSSQDFMQEMMSPTFIVLASCIAFATLVVVLLLGLICNRLCRSKAQNNGYTAANLQVTANFTSCGHEFYNARILYDITN